MELVSLSSLTLRIIHRPVGSIKRFLTTSVHHKLVSVDRVSECCPLYLLKVCSLSALIAGGLVVGACSMGGDAGRSDQLSGLSRSADDTGYRAQPRRTPPAQRQAYYSPPPVANAARSPGPNCATERAARRPFPSNIVVERGDNLCRIARRYQTTVQAIVDANRLTSSKITVGMRLQLPSRQYYSNSPYGRSRRR